MFKKSKKMFPNVHSYRSVKCHRFDLRFETPRFGSVKSWSKGWTFKVWGKIDSRSHSYFFLQESVNFRVFKWSVYRKDTFDDLL